MLFDRGADPIVRSLVFGNLGFLDASSKSDMGAGTRHKLNISENLYVLDPFYILKSMHD